HLLELRRGAQALRYLEVVRILRADDRVRSDQAAQGRCMRERVVDRDDRAGRRTDEVEALELQPSRHLRHLVGGEAVGGPIERDATIAGGRERGKLMLPHGAVPGRRVQKDHRYPAAAIHDVHAWYSAA